MTDLSEVEVFSEVHYEVQRPAKSGHVLSRFSCRDPSPVTGAGDHPESLLSPAHAQAQADVDADGDLAPPRRRCRCV